MLDHEINVKYRNKDPGHRRRAPGLFVCLDRFLKKIVLIFWNYAIVPAFLIPLFLHIVTNSEELTNPFKTS